MSLCLSLCIMIFRVAIYGLVCFRLFRICGVPVFLVVLKRFLDMTRKYSGEFSHENYSSFFCEVFDSCNRLAAVFHYRLYAGRPAVYVDNLSLTPGQLQYELGQFMFKAVICVGQKTFTPNKLEKVDVLNFLDSVE